MKSFITKGILPLLLLGTITWLGQYIFIVDGSIDWFRFMLVYGVPIGIPICSLLFRQDGIYLEQLAWQL